MNKELDIKTGGNVDFSVSLVLEKLKTGLSAVERVVTGRSSLPILNNVLIKVTGGGIELLATDLEVGMRIGLTGKIDKEGEITVPGRAFINLVSSLHGDTVELSLKDGNVYLSAGESKAMVNGVSGEDFPVIPEVESEKVVKIKGGVFKELLNRVDFSVSHEESRPILTGIYLSSAEGKLILAATDSYRLSEISEKIDLGEEFSVVVPAKTLQEIKRSASDVDDIEIRIDENQIMFKFKNMSLVSRLIEGEYPPYKQIIPSESSITADFEIGEMVDVLKTASIFAAEGLSGVRFKIGEDGFIEVSSESSQLGNFTSKVNADVVGGEGEISFNAKYILDGLNSFDTPRAILGITNKTSAGVFRPSGVMNQVYITMPLRV